MSIPATVEIDPPKGKDPNIWRLLTTLPVVGEPDEFAAACDIVRLYRLRWRIEQVFRSMKSDGFCLEETQVQDAARLFNLTAIALTAAVRTIQLVDARDGGSRPASDVADPPLVTAAHAIGPTLEGRTARQKNPHQLGSLPWLSWIVARLGGWNCTTSRQAQRLCEPLGTSSPQWQPDMLLLSLIKMFESRSFRGRGSVGTVPVSDLSGGTARPMSRAPSGARPGRRPPAGRADRAA
jgi:hypothetical protein